MPGERLSPRTTSSPQEFIGFTRRFLREKKAATVIEIGPDAGLRVASALHKACKRYVAVGQETEIMRAGFTQGMQPHGNLDGIELVTGNAVSLSSQIPTADVILLHNVLLTLQEQDAMDLAAHNNGGRELQPDALRTLVQRLNTARFLSYRECLAVANPGYVLSFNRTRISGPLTTMLTQDLGVTPRQIEQVPLLYDRKITDEPWELTIVDNT